MTLNGHTDVSVIVDDRVRLIAAALAGTTFPDTAQALHAHGTHAHARATRKRMSPFKSHEAIRALQTLLDQRAPVEALFTLALVMKLPDFALDRPPRWMPAHWNDALHDLYLRADLPQWWADQAEEWTQALHDSQRVFASIAIKPFLSAFVGNIRERFFFIPNICYPGNQELGVRLGSDLVCIIPPRLAWGDSPPWPYDEDPAHVYRAVMAQFGRLLMMDYLRIHAGQIGEIAQTPLPVSAQFQSLYPTWQEQFTNLFVAGAVAIFLEDHVSKAESQAYVLMERKVRGITILPGMISVLKRYLSEKAAGRYDSLIDFLPLFPRQLKVANRIAEL